MKKKINHLDLFSGIGGFHLGFEKAGYKVNSFFSEIDKHAIAVYKNQFKNSTYVGSVTDLRGADLPTIDLITFGSPCQDFSLSGGRKGMGGERSSLILEAIRLIRECRPRVFVWENVKGTFSSNNGEDFASIIQAFAQLGGYTIEWKLLNTSWFGIPQNRERIYLVGYSATPKRDWRGVFPIGGGDFQNHGKRINIVGNRGTGGQQGFVYGDDGIAPCVNAHIFADPMKIKVNLPNGDYLLRRITPIECERLQGFPDNHTSIGDYDGDLEQVSNTQRYKMCGNAVTVNVVQAVAEKLKGVL